jgi:hypothetical protein
MTWFRSEKEYEGLPLLLRYPNYSNVWQFESRLTKLVSIEHILDKVNTNGLPEAKYNSTLAEFDYYMASLFDKSSDGIILLVETFSGKRNYYYYTLPNFNFDPLIEKAKLKFKVSLDSWSQLDINWGFLKEYPFQILPK